MNTALSGHLAKRGTILAILVASLIPLGAAAGLPVALYPVQGDQLSASEVADVQSLVEIGLRRAIRRDVLEPRQPLLLRDSCPAPAADACLAKLAKGGAVLYARARRQVDMLIVTMALVTADGRRTKAIAVGMDPYVQNLNTVDRGLALLEAEIVGSPGAPSLAQGGHVPETTPAAAPSSAPMATRREIEEPTVPGAWQKPVGVWCTIGGATLLAGGVTFGLLDKKLSNDLTKKYQNNTLTAADRSKYDRVKTYNVLATSLLIGGSVITATGIYFWSMAPSVSPYRGGAQFSLSGQF